MKPCLNPRATRWQNHYLKLLPAIQKFAGFSFRGMTPDARSEATAEVVASCFVAFVRLVSAGKTEQIYATALARFAVAQYFAGRRVGCSLNSREVTSTACQHKHEYSVESISPAESQDEPWEEIAIEDRSAGPAETACFRIDFDDWRGRLDGRSQSIVDDFAVGGTTSTVAKKYGISRSRVSQIRAELAASWDQFQGAPAAQSTPPVLPRA